MTGSTSTFRKLGHEALNLSQRKGHRVPDNRLPKQSIQSFRRSNGTLEVKGASLIDQEFPLEIVWIRALLFGSLHVAALYGTYMAITGQVMWLTLVYTMFLFVFGGLGVTAGNHRLWAHKSYKAKLPLRMLLAIMQTFAFQYSILDWSRNHRVHHKYSETNADPHNAKRGFFFAHIGWLCCRRHPAFIEKVRCVDVSDLEADSIVMFQDKYYWPLVAVLVPVIPFICMYFWGECLAAAIFFATLQRFCVSLNCTNLVNSAAHLWGPKPYDRNVYPADNLLVSIVAGGEGSHNYHHTFPWDYKTDELGHYPYNLTKLFLDLMAWIGWAYDLKTVPNDAIMARVARTGDGTHHTQRHRAVGLEGQTIHQEALWGWGDKNISKADIEVTRILCPAIS